MGILAALGFLLVLFFGPLWPLSALMPERAWWILLVVLGLALALPRPFPWKEAAVKTKPAQVFSKKDRLLVYLRAAERSVFARETLGAQLLELAAGFRALERKVSEEEAWREIRAGFWPKAPAFRQILNAEYEKIPFLQVFAAALDALERESQ